MRNNPRMCVLAALAVAVPFILSSCVVETPSGVPQDPILPGGSRGSGEPATDPASAIAQTNAVAATAELRRAEAIAAVYLSENGSLEGFTPEIASQYDPGVVWNALPTAIEGEISIRGATPVSIVLVTKSSGGDAMCLAVEAGADVISTLGTADAAFAAQCTASALPSG